jgi:hypothetical protein
MSRILFLLPVISLATVCVSCTTSLAPPEATTSSASTAPQLGHPLFQHAIAVRDELTTVFLGSLNPGELAPPILAITFYDAAGRILETFPHVTLDVAHSGLVYATPGAPLPPSRQHNITMAVAATVTDGSIGQSIDVGEAVGTISFLRLGYSNSLPDDEYIGYGPCPHCLTSFLCNCLNQRDAARSELTECSLVEDETPFCENTDLSELLL